MKKSILLFLPLLFCLSAGAKNYRLQSPDKRITVTVTDKPDLSYSVTDESGVVLAPSEIGLTLSDGTEWGRGVKVRKTERGAVGREVPSPLYKRATVRERYNFLTLRCGDFSVEFRAFDDGVAYRFVSAKTGDYRIAGETAAFRFDRDYTATVPFVRADSSASFEKQFFNSFENTYTTAPLSELGSKRLMFLPLVVALDGGRKVCITEVNLESYPGMYLNTAGQTNGLKGVFAPYPKEVEQGGHNRLQMLVTERAPYIAEAAGPRAFPWRAMVVSRADRELANSDLVYQLADECRVKELSWIRPGKVAWEWWNDWNVTGVDFRAGVNTDTYKYYIDFAAEYGIEYVILDEGWAVNLQADLFQVVPEIDLPGLVAYGKAKGVGLILWAGHHAFERDLEKVCDHYGQMGVKGFKVDFMDRDDQQISDFLYRAAAVCADRQLLLDFHGIYKPTGLFRTYPNVINYEGVFGMEQLKWDAPDMPKNDATLPFIRMVAGPMDYTQGAMRNAGRYDFRAMYSFPMSQGTRCHQLAEYVVFESPLNMLCDSPVHYRENPVCTRFIASVPTVWDETVVVDGKMGEYIATARRKGDVWYLGAITDWSGRELTLDLSFLGDGSYLADVFRDGVNADRNGTDFVQETVALPADRQLTVRLADGGGYAARIYRK